MAVASRKESYHARSRRPPRGEEKTMDYFYTELRLVRLGYPASRGYLIRNIPSLYFTLDTPRAGLLL